MAKSNGLTWNSAIFKGQLKGIMNKVRNVLLAAADISVVNSSLRVSQALQKDALVFLVASRTVKCHKKPRCWEKDVE